MGFNIGPRVIRATGGSISRQGRKVVHHFPPQHVTDGLQLHIDVGDKRCLGSWDDGTDINDLSGHNRTMTRSGGQLWSSYAGGVWDFDGSNDEIYIRDGSLSKGIGKHFTYELWHRCDTNNTRQGLLSTHRSQGGSHQDAVLLPSQVITTCSHELKVQAGPLIGMNAVPLAAYLNPSI